MLLLPLANVYRNMITSFLLEEYLFNELHSQSISVHVASPIGEGEDTLVHLRKASSREEEKKNKEDR
jgi:hypothetical protein